MKSTFKLLAIAAVLLLMLVGAVRIPLMMAENRAIAVCSDATPGMSLSDFLKMVDANGYRDHLSQVSNQVVLVTFKSAFMEKFTCVVTISADKVASKEVTYAD